MRLLPAIAVLVVFTGCLRDVWLPPEPTPGGGGGGACSADSECALGLCDPNGACDKTQCRTDANCQSQVCVGGSPSKAGRCGIVACTSKADCGAGKTCKVDASTREASCVEGCTVDSDCAHGLCSNNVCNPAACNQNAQCESQLCVASGAVGQPGRCGVRQCTTDSNCATGKKCNTLSTQETYCTDGCRLDADCPGACDTCAGGSPTQIGLCIAGVGPAISGNVKALKMTDNLASAVAFVRAKNPGAFLIQINGSSLKADGTVDITADYLSRWMYGFQLGDGSMAPAKLFTVTYLLQGGTKCGLYDGNAGNISQKDEVPDATWAAFRDATTLVTAFKAQPNCVAPAQTSSDYIIYDQQSTGPRFILGNWKSQLYLGDPVTGTAMATCP
jgi:hypothetical protein